MGARNRERIWLSYRPARLCSLGSLESILGLLKSLKNSGSVPIPPLCMFPSHWSEERTPLLHHLSLHTVYLLYLHVRLKEGRCKQESLLCSVHEDVHRPRRWISLHSTAIWKRQKNYLLRRTIEKKEDYSFLVSWNWLQPTAIPSQLPSFLLSSFFLLSVWHVETLPILASMESLGRDNSNQR